MPKPCLLNKKFQTLTLLSPLIIFFLSGCALSNKFSLPGKNPATEKSAELINAQRLNQQVLNNPIPLVPGKKPETAAPPASQEQTQEAISPETETPETDYDQEKWKELAGQYAGATLKTNLGSIEVDFFSQQSPLAVGNFIELAQKNFYDQTKFHRVIKDFMLQGGDPNSKDSDWSDDGKGGPGYKFPDETGTEKLVKGALAMANSGPNTNGSQFFIVTAKETSWLDGKHTVFGKVANEKSLKIVDKIEKVETDDKDHPTEDVVIESIELKSKEAEKGEEEKAP